MFNAQSPTSDSQARPTTWTPGHWRQSSVSPVALGAAPRLHAAAALATATYLTGAATPQQLSAALPTLNPEIRGCCMRSGNTSARKVSRLGRILCGGGELYISTGRAYTSAQLCPEKFRSRKRRTSAANITRKMSFANGGVPGMRFNGVTDR